MAKATKQQAHYRDGTAARHCGLCTMFRPPRSCTAVAGDISPDGVCDYFKRRAKTAAERSAGRYGKRA